jgi:hypothetical protein
MVDVGNCVRGTRPRECERRICSAIVRAGTAFLLLVIVNVSTAYFGVEDGDVRISPFCSIFHISLRVNMQGMYNGKAVRSGQILNLSSRKR